MNNTLNKKIEQVTNKTLIVGVDIGSEIHYATLNILFQEQRNGRPDSP